MLPSAQSISFLTDFLSTREDCRQLGAFNIETLVGSFEQSKSIDYFGLLDIGQSQAATLTSKWAFFTEH